MGFKLMDWIKGKGSTTFQLTMEDVVVFVVGPSGGGKSLFVEEVTKSGLVRVGDNFRPCTEKVQAIRCDLSQDARSALGAVTQKSIVFVDTPSFHAEENDRAEKEMNSWLTKSKSKSTLVGIIYVHRVETDPTGEPMQRHLNTFAYTFPEGFVSLPQRLHAVLSYEGKMSQARTEQHEKNLRTQLSGLMFSRTRKDKLLWRTSFHPNLFRQGDSETAWQAVVELFSHPA